MSDFLQAVLICGWREEAFMSDMLREMDHGPSALPAGSQLTLFNSSTNVEIMARVKARNRCALTICPVGLQTCLCIDLYCNARRARVPCSSGNPFSEELTAIYPVCAVLL